MRLTSSGIIIPEAPASEALSQNLLNPKLKRGLKESYDTIKILKKIRSRIRRFASRH